MQQQQKTYDVSVAWGNVSKTLGTSEILEEPDPDDSGLIIHRSMSVAGIELNITEGNQKRCKPNNEPDPDDLDDIGNKIEPDPDDSQDAFLHAEPDPDDSFVPSGTFRTRIVEPDPDDQELQIIQDPITAVFSHMQKAIEMLQSGVSLLDAVTVLQTLFMTIRNVIEHPDNVRFRGLQKVNPLIQQNFAGHRAIGFNNQRNNASFVLNSTKT